MAWDKHRQEGVGVWIEREKLIEKDYQGNEQEQRSCLCIAKAYSIC